MPGGGGERLCVYFKAVRRHDTNCLFEAHNLCQRYRLEWKFGTCVDWGLGLEVWGVPPCPRAGFRMDGSGKAGGVSVRDDDSQATLSRHSFPSSALSSLKLWEMLRSLSHGYKDRSYHP